MTNGNARRCVFCGNTPVTKEHILPQWVNSLLVNGPRALPTGKVVHMRKNAGAERISWEAPYSLDSFVTKTVCARCNNGWMSEVERGGLVCLNSAARFDKWNRAAVR